MNKAYFKFKCTLTYNETFLIIFTEYFGAMH